METTPGGSVPPGIKDTTSRERERKHRSVTTRRPMDQSCTLVAGSSSATLWREEAQVSSGPSGRTRSTLIERKYNNSPVYEVRPEGGSGRTQDLHWNLLLPCDFLPVEQSQPEIPKPATRRHQRDRCPEQPKQREDPQSSSEEEDDWRGISATSLGRFGQPSSQLRLKAEDFVP